MKKTFLFIIFMVTLCSTSVIAQSNPPIKVREVDGFPSRTNPTELIFPNGSLTIVGSRVTITTGGGGGSGDMVLADVQTVTGKKTFNSTKFALAGSTSGSTILNAAAVAGSGTVVLPTTGTLSTLAGSEALSGKTYNGLTITSSTGTLTVTNSKTASFSNTLTFTGTDSSSVAFGSGGTVAYAANNLSVFASTTSAQLAGIISNETGSGVLVFNDSPTFISPTLGTAVATSLSASGLSISGGSSQINLTTTGGAKIGDETASYIKVDSAQQNIWHANPNDIIIDTTGITELGDAPTGPVRIKISPPTDSIEFFNASGTISFGDLTALGSNTTFTVDSANSKVTLVNGVISIGTTTPDSTAILTIESTTLGFLPPRMTTTQRNNISSPAEGLLIYDLTLHGTYYFNGTSWTNGTGAPANATYITQTSNATLTNEQALSSLATGIVKNTTTTGVLSIAAAATDYVSPGATTTSGLTMTTARLLGRTTTSTGSIEEISIGSGLSLSAGVLSASGGGGANTSLSNLASIAINTSLISDTDNTDDLGSNSIKWKDGYFSGNLIATRFKTSGPQLMASAGNGNTVMVVASDDMTYRSIVASQYKIGADDSGAADVSFTRAAAGIGKISDGSSGSGSLQLLHAIGLGSAPSISSCGTSPAITGTDLAGKVDVGVAATGCSITFATAFASAPKCAVSSRAGIVFSYTTSTTAITITAVGVLASTSVDYVCVQ